VRERERERKKEREQPLNLESPLYFRNCQRSQDLNPDLRCTVILSPDLIKLGLEMKKVVYLNRE
jgi:hypothetical protein